MGKKRKTQSTQAVDDHLSFNAAESRKRIRTFEDVAGSDDEFHMNRDQILLEEAPTAKRRRQIKEQEAFLEQSDEEVLDGIDAASEDDDEQDEQDDDEQDDEEDESAGSVSEEEEEGWGTSRADLYGADAIETEEQALEEENEARRLQKKQLQAMTAADFGFDEDEWAATTTTAQQKIVTETLPELQLPEGASDKERLKLLKTRYPEFELLSKELLDLDELVRIGGMPSAKSSAANAYLGALTMYFALFTSTASQNERMALSAQELRNHDIMTVLVECKALWQNASKIPNFPEVPGDDEYGTSEPPTDDEYGTSELPSDGGYGTSEPPSEDEAELNAQAIRAKTQAERHAEALQAQKTARIAERLKRTEAENADLDMLLATTTKPSKRRQQAIINDDRSDIGEEVPLTKAQAEEKARRKKSLRFYTSQIAQKANKRGAAGRTAGGDDDIPHRERLRDRQARLNAEAEKRGKRSDAGDDLDGGSEDGDADQARRIRQDQDEDYYDMVAARTAKKKSDKKAYAEAQKRAEDFGGRVVQEETVGADGKRKITYAIEKNKGLTPYRKKDVRNPRVKKRKKFEEKTKKLASMKPTFKGGEGRGGYGGELTGIKANLVKSTKL